MLFAMVKFTRSMLAFVDILRVLACRGPQSGSTSKSQSLTWVLIIDPLIEFITDDFPDSFIPTPKGIPI